LCSLRRRIHEETDRAHAARTPVLEGDMTPGVGRGRNRLVGPIGRPGVIARSFQGSPAGPIRSGQWDDVVRQDSLRAIEGACRPGLCIGDEERDRSHARRSNVLERHLAIGVRVDDDGLIEPVIVEEVAGDPHARQRNAASSFTVSLARPRARASLGATICLPGRRDASISCRLRATSQATELPTVGYG
jgi:hypothetical protein